MRKKDRIPTVFDTNVFGVRFIKHKRTGLNRRVFDLWERRRILQLVISPPVKAEYLGVLENYFNLPAKPLEKLRFRLDTASNITRVNLGKRLPLSRDPKDNMLLETAYTGRAKSLVTRDLDLLDIPPEDLRGLRFEIVTPFQLLQALGQI